MFKTFKMCLVVKQYGECINKNKLETTIKNYTVLVAIWNF